MRTQVCDMLGIEFPILAFSHCRDVVAAVSKAGGFGVLGATAFTPEQLDIELNWIENELGDKPYGVDVLIPVTYAGKDGVPSGKTLRDLIPDEHRKFVNRLMEKYEVPELPKDEVEAFAAQGRVGMTIGGGVGALVDVSLQHPIRLIASALGPPPAELVTEAHNRGILVAALAGRKDHALRHQAIGVDIIVAQGYEAGGHTGEIATMVLVPEVVDAVAPMPVIAAGGIASGRQMAAAMALGAQGVWCGSVWLTTEEAETAPIVKDKFLAASSSDTLRSRSTTGKPARQLKSAWTDEWEDPANPDPLPMPLQPMLIGEAQARIRRAAKPGNGAADLANYYVGQVVGSLNRVKSTRQVVEEMVAEYVEVATKFSEALTTLSS
jgi:NAD(P)H-dependent flavin oxidoreductase YrpB (nitropropane dioxygenase family)